MVDIMLGREYGDYIPENQRVLLDILAALTKWHDDHKECIEKKETYKYQGKEHLRSEWNFFAEETWKGMQMLILSHVKESKLYHVSH